MLSSFVDFRTSIGVFQVFSSRIGVLHLGSRAALLLLVMAFIP